MGMFLTFAFGDFLTSRIPAVFQESFEEAAKANAEAGTNAAPVRNKSRRVILS